MLEIGHLYHLGRPLPYALLDAPRSLGDRTVVGVTVVNSDLFAVVQRNNGNGRNAATLYLEHNVTLGAPPAVYSKMDDKIQEWRREAIAHRNGNGYRGVARSAPLQ